MANILYVARDGYSFKLATGISRLLSADYPASVVSLAQLQANPSLIPEAAAVFVFSWAELLDVDLSQARVVILVLSETLSLASAENRQLFDSVLPKCDFLVLTDPRLYSGLGTASELPPVLCCATGFDPDESRVPATGKENAVGILVSRWFGQPRLTTDWHNECVGKLEHLLHSSNIPTVRVKTIMDLKNCRACVQGVWGGYDGSMLLREALMSGRPVLVNDEPTWLPLICHGRSGWMADFFSDEHLAAGLSAVLRQTRLYTPEAARFRVQTVARHIWAAYGPDWRSILHRILG